MNPVTGGCYCRYGWRETPDDRLHAFFDEKKAEEMRVKYRHPLWKQAGELAKAVEALRGSRNMLTEVSKDDGIIVE